MELVRDAHGDFAVGFGLVQRLCNLLTDREQLTVVLQSTRALPLGGAGQYNIRILGRGVEYIVDAGNKVDLLIGFQALGHALALVQGAAVGLVNHVDVQRVHLDLARLQILVIGAFSFQNGGPHLRVVQGVGLLREGVCRHVADIPAATLADQIRSSEGAIVFHQGDYRSTVPADLAADHAQRQQRVREAFTVVMTGGCAAGVNAGGLGRGILLRKFLDGFRRDAADLGRPFRCLRTFIGPLALAHDIVIEIVVRADLFRLVRKGHALQRLILKVCLVGFRHVVAVEADTVLIQILLVVEIVRDDMLDHAEDHCGVGAGTDRDPGGVQSRGRLGVTRLDRDEFCSGLLRLQIVIERQALRRDRRVAAPEDHQLLLAQVKAVRSVPEVSAVHAHHGLVDIRPCAPGHLAPARCEAAQSLQHLREIAAARYEAGLRSVLVIKLLGGLGNQGVSLIPGNALPFILAAEFAVGVLKAPVFALHRVLQAVCAEDLHPLGPASLAGTLLGIIRGIGVTVVCFLAYYYTVFHQRQVDAAPAAVVPARCRDPFSAGLGIDDLGVFCRGHVLGGSEVILFSGEAEPRDSSCRCHGPFQEVPAAELFVQHFFHHCCHFFLLFVRYSLPDSFCIAGFMHKRDSKTARQTCRTGFAVPSQFMASGAVAPAAHRLYPPRGWHTARNSCAVHFLTGSINVLNKTYHILPRLVNQNMFR